MRRRLGADLLPGPGHAEPGHLPPGAPVTSQGDILEENLVTSRATHGTTTDRH